MQLQTPQPEAAKKDLKVHVAEESEFAAKGAGEEGKKGF